MVPIKGPHTIPVAENIIKANARTMKAGGGPAALGPCIAGPLVSCFPDLFIAENAKPIIRPAHSSAVIQRRLRMENRCVCCGAIIPEGRQVCPKCERGGEDGKM